MKKTNGKINKLLYILLCISIAFGVCSCGKDSDNNENYMDLSTYFGLNSTEVDNPCAIVIDHEIVGYGIVQNDRIYIPYGIVRTKINNKFYIDKNENILMYTTPDKIIESKVGSDKYIDETEKTFEDVISINISNEYYVSFDFVIYMSNNVRYEQVMTPARLVISTVLNNTVAQASSDDVIRYEASAKSERLIDVKENDTLYIIEKNSKFTKVADSTGIVGYINTDSLKESQEVMDSIDYVPATYSHNLLDEKVCLAWQQMEVKEGNGALEDYILETKGLNVISPTWYQIDGYDGNIKSCSDEDYVRRAHSYGLQVWGLVSDFNADENNNYYINDVLASTTSRRNLISNLLSEVEKTKMDGINIDFEKIYKENSEDYIEFIRELSIECRKRGIILSVDMYIPTDYNRYYDRTSVGEVADYVIVFGYDEHWAGCQNAGSTASIGFVTNGIEDTIAEVEPSRVINAIPFYTRVWIETPEELADPEDEIIEDSVIGNYTLNSFAVGMGTAKRYLAEHNVNPTWMEELGQYYGEYKIDGVTYRIWLEEHDSIRLKLSVMEEKNIAGVACWKLGLEINDIWDIINEYLEK